MASLSEIRAKLKAADQRSSGGAISDRTIYPFWNLKEGQESIVRFLPDADPNNTFFWAERLLIKLPFNGVKGESESKPVAVQVPCVEMYGQTCPVLSEVRAWFKDPSLEEMGRKYWKKKSYIFQGFVVEDGLSEDSTPENPIRKFVIGPQIFQLIRSALLDAEMEELPTDYVRGLDFRIRTTKKGGYTDYATSTWARKERPLNEAELSAINDYGLNTLSEWLPKKPTAEDLVAIKEMFEASVDGEAYDPDRWAKHYKPSGFSQSPEDDTKPETKTPAKSVSKPSVQKAAPKVIEGTEEENEDIDDSKPVVSNISNAKALDLLAQIRARQSK